MPRTRTTLPGAFGSGYFPEPVARIDAGQAIQSIAQGASSLVQNAYLRRVADENRRRTSEAERVERDRRDRLDRENAEYRDELVRLRRESAQPAPTWSESRGGWIVAPANGQPGRFIPLEGAPAPAPKPSEVKEATRAREDEAAAAAWLAQNRRNPDVLGIVNAIKNTNPGMTDGAAAVIALRAVPGLRDATAITRPRPATPEPGTAAPITNTERARVEQQARAFRDVDSALKNFEQQVASGVEVMPGQRRAELVTTYRVLQLQMKELMNLGVLNGPDLALIQGIINEPTGIWLQAQRVAGVKPEEVLGAQIRQVRQFIEDKKRNLTAPNAVRTPATPRTPEERDDLLDSILAGDRP